MVIMRDLNRNLAFDTSPDLKWIDLNFKLIIPISEMINPNLKLKKYL